MSLTSAIAIFFIIWWVVLFSVLPFGVRTQNEEGDVVPGSAESAPSKPLLMKKFLATTIVSAIVFAAFYYVYENKLISLDFFPVPFEGNR